MIHWHPLPTGRKQHAKESATIMYKATSGPSRIQSRELILIITGGVLFPLLERLSNAPPVRLLGSGTVADRLVLLAVAASCRFMRCRSLCLALPESARSIHADKLSTVALAVLEDALVKLSTVGVKVGAHDIVHMRRILSSLRTVCSAEGKLVCRHKVVPFLDLRPLALLSGYVVAEHQATFGVTRSIGTMRVKFTTRITTLNVHAREITHSRHLEEIGCLEELHSLNSTVRNEASTVTRFETVSDNVFLAGTDLRVGLDGSP